MTNTLDKISAGSDDIRSLADVLDDFNGGLTGDRVTMGTILQSFHERGFGILLLFFAAPMALPVPVPPGLNIALASPLLLLTAQLAMGRHTIWLPRRMKEKSLPVSKLKTLHGALTPWLRKLEFFIRPRLGFVTQGPAARLFGALALLMALAICIPVPLTNTVPSLGIALMAIGIGMRDGLAVLAGAVIGMAWISLLGFAVIIFGPEAFEIVKETIKSLIM